MDQDYLLVGVDSEKKCAVRFLCLRNAIAESLAMKNLSEVLRLPYVEFLLGGVLLGSRAKDQSSVLYKLHFSPSDLRINCEVNPMGVFRSAVFPQEGLERFTPSFKGHLEVGVLNKQDQVYVSHVEMGSGILPTLMNYLEKSIQSASLLFIHGDVDQTGKNYALWLERLPGTSDGDWENFKNRFSKDFFEKSFAGTDDPDIIVQNLFPSPLQILAVTKPQLTCSCRRDSFERALTLLPREDLLELFVEGKGIESRCDYCSKVWTVGDDFVSALLKIGVKPQ